MHVDYGAIKGLLSEHPSAFMVRQKDAKGPLEVSHKVL